MLDQMSLHNPTILRMLIGGVRGNGCLVIIEYLQQNIEFDDANR